MNRCGGAGGAALSEIINTLQAEVEWQAVEGKSRCAFEWQIRAIASLMHR